MRVLVDSPEPSVSASRIEGQGYAATNSIQEEIMVKFRLAILGAGAALALGTATAVAMESTSASSDANSHGKQVSAAAHSDATVGDDHGDAVSDVAQAESTEKPEANDSDVEGAENSKGARADAVAACKANDTDPNEKEPTTKAEKVADRAEDRTEHRAVVDCIAGHSTASGASK